MSDEAFQVPTYLVETDWLEQHLDVESLRIFDCTVNVELNQDPLLSKRVPFVYQSGRAHYEQQHIPHAGFIDILDELSDKSNELPLMMPSEEQFVDAMCKHGVNNDSCVVLYSTSEANWAARVWWMLRAFGFDNAVILNGGWKKWVSEGRPVSDKPCTYSSGFFSAHPRADAFVCKHDVLSAINDHSTVIISALPEPMHTGAAGFAFGRKGRIAGSVNVPFVSLHDPDTGRYLSVDKLQKRYDEVRIGDAQRIITYCGGGIASANSAFTLTMLGYDNVAVYDASMLEWGNDESLPMEMG